MFPRRVSDVFLGCGPKVGGVEDVKRGLALGE